MVKQEKHLEKSSEVGVEESNYSNGELLVDSNGDSKLNEDWILDYGYTFHM